MAMTLTYFADEALFTSKICAKNTLILWNPDITLKFFKIHNPNNMLFRLLF